MGRLSLLGSKLFLTQLYSREKCEENQAVFRKKSNKLAGYQANFLQI